MPEEIETRQLVEDGHCVIHPKEVLTKCHECLADWEKCNTHNKLLAFCLGCLEEYLMLPSFKDDKEKEDYFGKLELNKNPPEEKKS